MAKQQKQQQQSKDGRTQQARPQGGAATSTDATSTAATTTTAAATPADGAGQRYVPRLKQRFFNEVVPAMMKEFGYKNPMQVPRIEKVVLNIGMGSEARENARSLDFAVNDLSVITGQRPVITRAKKSIAQFKVRAGNPVGVMVTLRGNRMYDFLDRLFNIALPRVRDFSGVSPGSFDGHGNFALGLREQLIFPEVDYDKIDRVRGMEVVITTTARTDQEGRRLLELLGMPFRRGQR